MATIDDLATAVEAQSGVVGSVETLITGIRQQLADAIANGADPEEIQSLVDELSANTSRLAAAVQAPGDGGGAAGGGV